MSNEPGRILLAGETWLSYGIHQKGFSAYTTGGYDEGQRELVAALEAAGWRVDHIPNHLATEDFPWTAAELGAYNVVVLSDISADTLQLHPDVLLKGQRRPDRLQEIASYVDGGGGFLMIGGYMSFSGFEGKARYHGTAVESLLPVRMLGFDDRIERPDGVFPAVADAEHPIVAGIAGDWPHLLGYNRLVEDGGHVVLRVGEDPLLVVDERGGGRVAAFASDCSPHWGSPEFTEWSSYGPLWNQLMTWLASGASA